MNLKNCYLPASVAKWVCAGDTVQAGETAAADGTSTVSIVELQNGIVAGIDSNNAKCAPSNPPSCA
jgi:hypothetical protein